MKKILSFNLALVLMLLCGCTRNQENSATQFLFDTVVTLTCKCDEDILNGAFELCREYENLLSKAVADSDISKLNALGEAEVSPHTLQIIERANYYSALSNGKFDITICSVSDLWDFENQQIPNKDEISKALENVDYKGITINGNAVNTGGAKLDLGGIAKGYIADRICNYFTENGAENGIVDLGGNIVVFGDKDYTIGIKKPFGNGESCAAVKLKNKSIVTSGIYERSFEVDGTLYHHILDTQTGYPAKTQLLSASIISNSSFDADALATVCMLLPAESAREIIEDTPDTEAIFIDRDYNVLYTSGLTRENDVFVLR